MDIHYQKIQISNAISSDAAQLCSWWNDGKVMAHAGFPNGLGTTEEEIVKDIQRMNNQDRLCIIRYDGIPIGEMNYRIAEGNHVAEIGIKICNPRIKTMDWGS